MPPVLLIIGLGRSRRFPLPVPLFLLWPLVAVAYGILVLCQRYLRLDKEVVDKIRLARAALGGFAAMSGLKVDVRSQDGHGAFLWFV